MGYGDWGGENKSWGYEKRSYNDGGKWGNSSRSWGGGGGGGGSGKWGDRDNGAKRARYNRDDTGKKESPEDLKRRLDDDLDAYFGKEKKKATEADSLDDKLDAYMGRGNDSVPLSFESALFGLHLSR
eukprot:TRINITY_DN10841_c0_g1_i2.p2 TRINITY_DN10841_c0_g1~~TRINITY_DN10841_c0_g1_i2.p2  ORF type:complete len:147 (+),score=35.13 TRINITY_DN10841_c0_g1_i2:61-441(+)